jgi:pyrroline-5-carboxylate reductase
MTKLGFIGTGNLAAFFVEGLKRAGAPYDIMVSPRNAAKARELQSRYGVAIAANQDIADACELVVVSLLPPQADAVLQGLTFRAGQTVLSAMSGISLEAFTRMVRPASAAISMMPGLANAWNVGPSALYPDEPRARDMLACLGPVHAYGDGRTFMAASVMGAFSGLSVLMMRDAVNWFQDHGLSPEDARKLVAETVRGNAAMLLSSPLGLDAVAEGVVTKGGITEQGRRILDSGGSWSDALSAIHTRVTTRY